MLSLVADVLLLVCVLRHRGEHLVLGRLRKGGTIMVRGILIPTAEQRDPEVASFAELEDYQAAVGGWIEAVDVPTAGVTIYVNGEGIPRGLPFQPAGNVLLVALRPAHPSLRRRWTWYRCPGSMGSDWHSDPSGDQVYFEAIVWACLVVEIAGHDVEARIDPLRRQ